MKAELLTESGCSLLVEAARRNLTVELHHEGSNLEFCAARSRILGIGEHDLCLDLPHGVHETVVFSIGWFVDVFLAHKGKLYTFRSEVIQIGCVVQLNDGTKVEAIRITRPVDIKPGQRRQNFRVSLASIEPIIADIHEAAPDHFNAAPRDARRLRAWLVNLSTGGCGLITDGPLDDRFQIGRPLFVQFKLPNDATPLALQAQLRQVESVLDQSGTRLGLRFLKWPDPTRFGRMLRAIELFVAQTQRASARRVRRNRF